MKKINKNMLQGPLFGNIILYTIPIILTSVLQLLFHAADLVIVGRFRGSVSVGAVGATGAITALIVNLFIGVSVGTGVTVAHGLGGKQDDTVHRAVHTAIPTATISGIILTVIGLIFSETFLRWMNTPEDVLPLSSLYMKVYFGGITFSMIYNFCAAILRAAGDSKSPLIFLTLSGILNVILNVIFVTAFDMNVEGVALATVISQALSALLVVITLMHREDACKLELSKMKIYKPELSKMLRIGLPAGIQASMFSISNVIVQSSINSFNNVALMSGNAAAANIEGFQFVAMNSFHQTTLNFTGQNVGAKQYNRVFKILWLCLLSVFIMGAVISVFFVAFGPQLLGIYITDSQEAINYGLNRLAYVCSVYLICGLMDVSTGTLRGMGASVVPMIISVLGICGIRIGWIYTIFQIPQFHTPQVLYISYAVSWTVTFLAQLLAFFIVIRRQMRQHNLITK